MTNLDYLIDEYGLSALNTMTKYPSILTYHSLGERGGLAPSLVENKSFGEEVVYLTEKIDGTNSRFVFTTDERGQFEDFIIGSREDFLFAMNDRVMNPSLGIVQNLVTNVYTKVVGPNISPVYSLNPNRLYVVYGETYGGKINHSNNYTNDKSIYGFRMFDLVEMPIFDADKVLTMPIEKISSWRENGGLPFQTVTEIINFSNFFGIETVPYIKVTVGTEIPYTLRDVYEWLGQFAETNAVLHDDYSGVKRAEGVVVRTADRSLIRKIRFEDYEKTNKQGKLDLPMENI